MPVTTQTHSTIPSASAAFLTDLQTFLAEEDAERYRDMFTDFVVSGGVFPVASGLTHTPTALTAYANGFYLTESGSVTFANGQNNYVIANAETTGNLTGYTRVAGTHYLVGTGGSAPALPAGAIRIATVVTSGGNVTSSTDTRVRFALSLAQGGMAQTLVGLPAGTIMASDGTGMVPATVVGAGGVTVAWEPNFFQIIVSGGAGTNTWAVRGNRSFVATVATFHLAADAVVLRSSTNTQSVQHNPGSLTNTVTTAGPIINGRDQAAAFTVSTFVHFYWIWNGTTLASLSSAVAPPTGPTLPTGYTMWAYAGAVRFDGSSQLVSTRLYGDWAMYETAVVALAAGAATTETTVALSASVPANATQILLNVQARGLGNGGAVDTIAKIRYITAKDYMTSRIQVSASAQWNSTRGTVQLPNVGQQVFYLWTNTTNLTTNALDIDVLGYQVT